MACRSIARSIFATTLLTLTVLPLTAQQTVEQAITAERFIRPPAEIEEAALAPRHLNVDLGNPSPDGRFFVREQEDGPPTMAMFARPFYRLAGEQIDWQANRSRQWAIRSGVGLEVTNAATGDITTVDLPDGARVSDPEWSPDGSLIAFFVHTEDETHVYTADPTNGRPRQITRTPVMATLNSTLEWTPDSRSIVTTLVPADRGDPPVKPAVPTGPQVRLTTPETNRIRTYPDLLEGPFEHELLEYYSTSQLAVIEVGNRRERSVGEPGMISEVDVSPDGMYAKVERTRKPFSYIVPFNDFGTVEEIWNLSDGSVMTVLNEEEIDDGSPDDDSDNGDPEPRDFSWRPDGQGISFLQRDPRPDGDSSQTDTQESEEGERSRRQDHVKQWLPPFDSTSITTVYSSNSQLANVRYSEDAQTLFLTERQGETVHEYAVFLSDPDTRHTIRRGEGGGGGFGGFGGGRYPSIQTKTLGNGVSVVRTSADGNYVYLSGTEYHEDPMAEGPQSYLDRIEIRTGDSTRIYESENDNLYERMRTILDDDASTILVTRESPTQIRNTFIRNLETGELRQMTDNTDYTPDITRAQRFRYEVERVDGFKLAVDVTVPENWNGERLPGMIWFYPREYTGQEDYDEGRETYNKNEFPNIGSRSMEILVRRGYAVIEPDAPIVGDEGRMNDNYVHDLRNNLTAVIDHLDAEGIIDRSRLGVGGHSYGAFSTANAMMHTPYFKAGIAGDGNYNRTLTPFSFQRERRTLWESKDTYFSMSPLFFANNLNGALLMYHGEHDQNVGTFPINSWRLFEALESLGKTASLYMYPFEHHGPATEETLLDLWARWSAWLDKYVKGVDEQVTTDDGGARQ